MGPADLRLAHAGEVPAARVVDREATRQGLAAFDGAPRKRVDELRCRRG